jgi:hypothetical protein
MTVPTAIPITHIYRTHFGYEPQHVALPKTFRHRFTFIGLIPFSSQFGVSDAHAWAKFASRILPNCFGRSFFDCFNNLPVNICH